MNILCVIDSLGSGGAQRQLVELAIGFKSKGHDVSFLTYHNYPFYNSILEKHKILITCIQESNYLKRLFKMRSFIRHGKYDAVLSFLEAANFICEVAGLPYRKWKLVVGERSANPDICKRTKLRIYRWFHLFADYVVANSYANIELLRSANPLLSNSKCKVIYNIIDFNQWKPIKNFSYVKNSKINLVIAARHFYMKNLNGLVEAIKLLDKSDLSKIMLDWYGDRVTEPFFDNSFVDAKIKIKALGLEGIISFHPATHHITSKIQHADVIGLFSFYEGFPNIIAEGMACGKPVICSAVSDLPRILSYDSNLLCDPTDPKSIKQALSYLINLKKEQLRQIGGSNLLMSNVLFNRDTIITNYLALLSR